MSFNDTVNKGTPENKSAVPFSISNAAIIGAGIAGACMAQALHQRGITVTVYDAIGPAAEASGNPLGLIMLRLDRGAVEGGQIAARLNKLAFEYAAQFYEGLGTAGFVQRGVIDQLHDAPKRQALLDAGIFPPADLFAKGDALFQRLGGAIDPRRTILHLLHGITVKREPITDLAALEQDIVILANGRNLSSFTGLPLRYHAGQCDWASCAQDVAPIMGDGYAASHDGQVVFGATFDQWDDPAQMPPATAAGSAANIARLHNMVGIDVIDTKARASLRVSTTDRMPVAGLVRDNIYCIGALGPRGMTMAPLLASILTATIMGEPLPVPATMLALLEPSRLFDVRDVKDIGRA